MPDAPPPHDAFAAAASTDSALREFLRAYPFARDIATVAPAAAAFAWGAPSPDTPVANSHTPFSHDEIAELVAFNTDCDNAAAASLAQQLADPATRVVVTGQQPALLASPLYIFWKAATAIATARRLAAQWSRPVLPVFWIASDDDDFDELRTCTLLDTDGQPISLGRLVSRGGDAGPASPATAWNLHDSRDRILDTLRATHANAAPNARADETLAFLADALRDEPHSFERTFARILARSFGDGAMLFVAPHLRSLRRRGAAILARDLAQPGVVSALANAGGDALAQAGYHAQVQRGDRALNFYFHEDGARQRIEVSATHDDTLILRNPGTHTTRTISRAELATRLASAPEDFSPGVVLRPVVQDTALPTVAYIGGPGEVTYLAQLPSVYRQLGAHQAPVILRAHGIVLPAAAATRLHQLGIAPLDAATSREQLVRALAANSTAHADTLRALDNLDAQLRAQLHDLATSHPDLATRPAIARGLAKTRHSTARALARLRQRILHDSVANGDDAARSNLALLNLVAPIASTQDRALSPFALTPRVPFAEIAAAIMRAVESP